ncbi:hypothetical protein ACH5RR_013164 [Cinchona calisaya]|uniref:Uncharacterized protein n=1 Tax=Cinchona calisaya TaxID=153742 RepID=A0ABD3A2W7_9GENT
MALQLADRSIKIPKGVVEDVLVKDDLFYVLMDFFVLDTQPTPIVDNQILMILDCLLLVTSNALINCRNRVMQISFGNMKAELIIFDISRQPPDLDNINEVKLIDSLTHNTFLQSHYDDSLEACLTHFGCNVDFDKSIEEINTLVDSTHLMKWQSRQPKVEPVVVSPSLPKLPSIVEPTQLDLKPLSDTLKYAYLGPSKPWPVIIAFDLSDDQEFKLLNVLKEIKKL